MRYDEHGCPCPPGRRRLLAPNGPPPARTVQGIRLGNADNPAGIEDRCGISPHDHLLCLVGPPIRVLAVGGADRSDPEVPQPSHPCVSRSRSKGGLLGQPRWPLGVVGRLDLLVSIAIVWLSACAFILWVSVEPTLRSLQRLMRRPSIDHSLGPSSKGHAMPKVRSQITQICLPPTGPLMARTLTPLRRIQLVSHTHVVHRR